MNNEKILAIDPGPSRSAYVLLDADLRPTVFAEVDNDDVLSIVATPTYDHLAIEMVQSYGMPVGVDTFETVFWIGRFWECSSADHKRKIYRKTDVAMNLCHSMRATDATVRQALIDRFGGKGTKKEPGWFFGVGGHVWSAVAVGVTYADLLRRAS